MSSTPDSDYSFLKHRFDFIQPFFHFFHLPFGCRSRPANADRSARTDDVGIDIRGGGYEERIRIVSFTFCKEYFAIRTLFACHKEYYIVLLGKFLNIGNPVGYLTANRIEIFEPGIACHPALDNVYYYAVPAAYLRTLPPGKVLSRLLNYIHTISHRHFTIVNIHDIT